MDNTDKLLRAFIEASGYEVEGEYSVYYNISDELDYVTSVKPSTLLSQGDYPCRVEVDYKVTKRDEIIDGTIAGAEWVGE